MRHALLILALALAVAVPPASAGADNCFADYKAKRDNPLRLHYGVMQLQGECTRAAAQAEVAARLARAGWTLLNVISVFGPEGLKGKKANAGKFYLRF